MRYFVKTPWWLKKIYSNYVWDIHTAEKDLYLTFDDGPHPTITPFVLDELTKYNAKATFFCIGANCERNLSMMERIVDEGHSIGNHTYSHLNGWKTKNNVYLDDISKAAKLIDTSLFRPPYGRILRSQAGKVNEAMRKANASIVMWDVLSGDFDTTLSKEQCLKNVIDHAKEGSIIVFHDSEKARPLMEYALPKVLEHFSKKGFRFLNLSSLQNEE